MKPKEKHPGREAPGPPPPTVIDLCQQSQDEEDSYMPEQIAGVKRRQEEEAETPGSDDETNLDLDSPKVDSVLKERESGDYEESKTVSNSPPAIEVTESKTTDERATGNDDSPPHFDDNDAVILTFAEMYNYLHAEMKDLDNQAATTDESAAEYMQSMFTEVFTSHPAEPLENSKSHYPQLDDDEIETLLRLFIQDRKVGRADARKWKWRLYDITRAIYKSRRSLIDIAEHRITTAQVTVQSLTNMWSKRAEATVPNSVDQDVDMSDDTTSLFRFHRETYSPEDIAELRRICETAYDFPTQLRKPTDPETRIIKGLVEGTILCSKLPDFLKRICSNEALRKIQNTIHAQVEGDLNIKLLPEFPLHPDFQTKARLIGNITMGLESGRHNKPKIIAHLQAAKQVYYDRTVHAVHIIFWTREIAAKWSYEVKSLPFRNRTFPLTNEHPEDAVMATSGPVNSTEVWKRQVGADGVKNKNPRDRYHVRLLNVSRCMDEAAIDAYIRQRFQGIYTTWQEPSNGNQTLQTDTWDIFFKWPGCPSFLTGKRFVNWDGVKILVHHVSAKAAYPCFQCGASGHNRNRCSSADDHWKQPAVCITVTATEVAKLQRRESTITSVDEIDKLWQEEPDQSLLNHEPISSAEPQEQLSNAVPPSPDNHTSSSPESELDQWQTAQRGRQAAGSVISQRNPGHCTMTSTPRAILGKIKPKSPRTQTHENKFQVLKYTNPETASTNLEHKSPLEANRVSYGYQSQQMEKVSRLIMTQVNEKREPIPPEAMERISHLNISQLPAAKDAGAIILQKCGLEEVEADPNGNCQYYSIAMALLNRDCSLPGEAKLLETLTSKLKKGIAAAANHFFAEEFPHQNRVQMLEVQNGEKEKLTQNQSAEALQRHFKDIGGSKSQLDSSIDRRCWGSTTTLRMLAKILHRTIYMIDPSNGVANAHFSLFTAGERVCSGGKFTTVKEKIYRPEEITEWVKHLQKACLDITPQSGPPLVIIFRTSHYNWLRFSTEEKARPDEQIPRNNSDFEHAMDCNEDFLMEDTEATESHLNQEPPKGDLRTAPARLESESHTSQPTKFTGVKPRAQTEQEEQEDIEKYGGDRKEELKVFLTTGVHALVPAHRQPLRELDMTNEEQVLQWCMQYDVSKEVLANWQQELLTKESQDTFTPTPSPETPTSDSQWSEATSAEVVPAAQSAGNTVEHNEQHGVGRFKGDKEISTGIRQHIQELQSQWNQLRPEWDHHTAEPFSFQFSVRYIGVT